MCRAYVARSPGSPPCQVLPCWGPTRRGDHACRNGEDTFRLTDSAIMWVCSCSTAPRDAGYAGRVAVASAAWNAGLDHPACTTSSVGHAQLPGPVHCKCQTAPTPGIKQCKTDTQTLTALLWELTNLPGRCCCQRTHQHARHPTSGCTRPNTCRQIKLLCPSSLHSQLQPPSCSPAPTVCWACAAPLPAPRLLSHAPAACAPPT